MNADYFGRVGIFGIFGALLSFFSGVCSGVHVEATLMPFGISTMTMGFVGIGCYVFLLIVSFVTARRVGNNQISWGTTTLRWLDHFMVLSAVGFTVFLAEFAIRIGNACPFCYLLYLMNAVMFIHYLVGLFSRRPAIVMHDPC